MKKRLLLTLLPLAFLVAACSGANKPAESSQPKSSSSSSQQTSLPTSSAEPEESSEPEPASGITVTIDEAPDANHAVWAHCWDNGGNVDWAEVAVDGTSLSFEFSDENDWTGYLVVELVDGETDHPITGESGNWDDVVLRQTNNVTDFDQTEIAWKQNVDVGNTFVGIAPGGDWNDQQKIALVENPEAEGEYMVIGLGLEVGDIFYIQVNGNAWLHYPQMKSDSPAAASFENAGDNDQNFKVVEAGNYDLYVTATEAYIAATSNE